MTERRRTGSVRATNARRAGLLRPVLAAALCAIGIAGPAPPAGAQPEAGAQARLLDLIGRLEAPRGYDDYYRRVAAPPPRPLTAMRVAEVLAWQERIDARSRSEAAGRYQILEDTLRRLVRQGAVPPAARFDAPTQDRLAGRLLAEAGWAAFMAGRLSAKAFGNRLARTWAALPVLSGPKRGRSHYHGTAGNRARFGADAMLAFLKGLRPGGAAPATGQARARSSVIHDRPPARPKPRGTAATAAPLRTAWRRDPWQWD